MKRTVLGVVTAVFAIAVSAPAAEAQNAMTFGLAAGALIPIGDYNDRVKQLGLHGMATLGFTPTMVPFGVRIDGMYNSLKGDPNAFAPGEKVDLRVLAVTASGVFASPARVASPYLIGGVGYYYTDFSGPDSPPSGSDFGLNVGLGMKFNLSGFGTFVEIRYHTIFSGPDEIDNLQFIPITFGITF
jgi:hypothetical protein